MPVANSDARWLSGPARAAWYVHEGTPPVARRPRLLETVRSALRLRHYSVRTERAYVAWIRRYILFHGKRHPARMGAEEVSAFLSSLAVQGRVSARTWLDELVRASRPWESYSTGPVCDSSNALGSGSRTWSSAPTRSW